MKPEEAQVKIRTTLVELAKEVDADEGTAEFSKVLDYLTNHVAVRFGLPVVEQKPRRAVLTAKKVTDMRADWATGEYDLQGLAEKYGVSHSNVWRIVNRKLWTNI